MIGSAVLGAGTAVASGVQQSNQAEAESELAKNNATAAAQQASAAEDAQRRRSRSILARQRAAIAESGIGFGGSSEVLQQDSAVQAELDALTVRYEGRMRGLGFQTDASVAKSRSKSAMAGGYLAASGQLLGGAADAYAMKRT
jgi:hypothetical protein